MNKRTEMLLVMIGESDAEAARLRADNERLRTALRHVSHDLIVARAHRNTGTVEHCTADRMRAERELLAPHYGDVPNSAPIESALTIARAALGGGAK